MAVKKNKKILKSKEIEYGSTRKKYIDKSLEETLKKSGFERKPKQEKLKELKLPKEVIRANKVDPDQIKVRLPRNIDSDLLIKPEKKVKKIQVKEERKIVDLPSHLEFEAPETIQVKTGIKRLTGEIEGAEYGDLPGEIDVVHEETKEEKKLKKKSFFSTIKQTLGFSDDEGKEEEEDLDKKKEELKKQIELKEGQVDEKFNDAIKKEITKSDDDETILDPVNLTDKIKPHKPMIVEDVPVKSDEPKEVLTEKEEINDEDEMGLEPIKFTDKIKSNEQQYMPPSEPEVLENDVEDEDSSMEIMYSRPKKKRDSS